MVQVVEPLPTKNEVWVQTQVPPKKVFFKLQIFGIIIIIIIQNLSLE
jgi:hypothetical protein